MFEEILDPYAEQRRVLASRGSLGSVSSKRQGPDTSVTEAAIAKLRTRSDMRSRSLEHTVSGVLQRNPDLGSVLGEFLNSAPALADKPKACAQSADAFASSPAGLDPAGDDEGIEDATGGKVTETPSA